MIKVLVTGTAGFIGSNLVDKLLEHEHEVVGIDNFNDYYDPNIKEKNLSDSTKNKSLKLYRLDILSFEKLKAVFSKEKPHKVIHLAARAGVRPSRENPELYTQVNVLGTVNLLKLSADFKIKQFIFGSSSSVYGNSSSLPFSEDDPCEMIISPYGASKRAAEFWVESFYRTYGLKSVILRFFTVYGPRGRVDMAPSLFTKAVVERRPIEQFGDGSSSRDYTYIDDVVDGILKVVKGNLDFEIINLGNNHPVKLYELIKIIEDITGEKAKIRHIPKQVGDVEKTWANIENAKNLLEWQPKIFLPEGLAKYIRWLREN